MGSYHGDLKKTRIFFFFSFLFLLLQPLNFVFAETLEEELKYLGILESKAELDYQAPKLQTMLKKRNSYNSRVLKLYLTFINWDQNRNSSEAINESKALFKSLAQQSRHQKYSNVPDSKIESEFYGWFSDKELIHYIENNEFPQNPDQERRYYKLPLWLVLKYPKVLDHDTDRFPLEVGTPHQVKYLPEFIALKSILKRMADGRWATTSYSPHAGTIIYDIYAAHEIAARLMSFNPKEILEYNNDKTIKDNLRPLRIWGSQGLWNSLLYKKFLTSFEDAVVALQNFYQNNSFPGDYSKSGRKLLSAYVYFYMPNEKTTPAFSMIESYSEKELRKALEAYLNGNSKNFKKYTSDFSEIRNELLARAILKGFSSKTIKLIITTGAGVNAYNFAETPLMNAANKPGIMKLLIKKGAKVNAANPFGKTALFYAIQFGNYEAVKILIEAGADVNKKLYNIDDLKKLSENYNLGEYFLLEQVADFTPLVYAKRYGSETVLKLLLSHGATLGNASKDRIAKWVEQGKLDL